MAEPTPSKVTGEESKKNSEVDDGATASLYEVFSNADAIDGLYMAVGTVGAIITGLSMPALMVLMGRVTNALNEDGTDFSDTIAELCIALAVLGGINIIAGFLQVYCWTYTGERQMQRFREQYVHAILSQEIGWFDTCGAGELATRVAEVSGKIQDGMGRRIGDTIQYIAQLLGSFIVAFYMSWKLALVLIAGFPLIGGAGAFMINAITAAQNQSLGQYAAAGGLATEALSAIRTITALNAQPDVISRYRVYLFTAMQVGIKKGFNVGIGNGMMFSASFLVYALGFWYAGTLVADSIEDGCTGDDCVNGGKVITAFFCMVFGSESIGQIAPPITAFVAAKAALRSLLDVVNRKPLIDGLSAEGRVPETKPQGAIEVQDVHFAYPSRPDIEVCRGYALSIAPGETVALVGASGCGKSTLINLLLRFYDPQSGSIRLDGHDIKELNIRWLRHQIGYVGQEPILFAGTVADNIAYGLPAELTSGPSKLSKEELRERVVAAAKLANAHDFISDFPQGYDTDVGSSGSAMSGGQKQRIAIARALIKKPAVLLLDEATSALDATSERVVQESIDALQRSKAQTCIVIAHRLSTIRNADKICLINQGRFAEMGTHDELVARGGLYADLVSLQMSGHDEDTADGEDKLMEDAVATNEGIEQQGEIVAVDERQRAASQASIVGSVGGGPAASRQYASVAQSNGKAASVAEPELSKEEAKQVSSRIWGMLYKHKGWMLIALIGGILFGGIFPAWGMMLAYSQNMFFLDDPDDIRERAAFYSYLYIMLAGVAFGSALALHWGVAQVGERVSIALRSQMFESIMRRDVGFFDHEENSIGTLATRLSDDSRVVNKAFGESLAKQMQAFFTLLVALVLGLQASWKIALVMLATFPISVAAASVQMAAYEQRQYEDDDVIVAAANQQAAGKAKKLANEKKASVGGSSQGDTKKIGKGKGGKTEGGVVSGGHGAVISTAFTHMRTVSAFTMQHRVAEHYAKLTRELGDARVQRSMVGGLGFGCAQASMFCTDSLMFWYGAELILDGEISFLQLMIAMMTLMLGAFGLGAALSDAGNQKEGMVVAARIFKDIDAGAASPIDGLSTTGQAPERRTQGRIVLRDVNFRYPTRPDVQVCKHLELSIEPGEMVAFVGPSGSGKSTIINLLLRFYDPLSGTITLDGVNIKDLNVRWLRSQIGYVGQEPVLFTGSVAENIAKGRIEARDQPVLPLSEAMKVSDAGTASSCPAGGCCANLIGQSPHDPLPATDLVSAINGGDIELGAPAGRSDRGTAQDVVEAAIASNAHDFITTFPLGYGTDVGEGSIMVSGGQKQRIAIARALIKKPAVLLLDEATSALDATSERVVQESIDALQRSKAQTCIVIAHRLSTIRNADKIVVIDKGAVVEVGKHDDLVAKGGLYATLWAKQSGTPVTPNKAVLTGAQ